MSFTRVRPTGWSLNAKLTSGEMNQLDEDHQKSLDKTGDSITGRVTVSSGQIAVTGSNQMVFSGSAWPSLAPDHTGAQKIRFYTFGELVQLNNLNELTGAFAPITGMRGGDYGREYYFIVPVHDGSRLDGCSLLFTPNNLHTGLPQYNINLGMYKYGFTPGASTPDSPVQLAVTSSYSYTPVSLADYTNSNSKLLHYSASQNNTVDNRSSKYVAYVREEWGTNSKLNLFHGLYVTSSNITDMRHV